MYSWDKIVLLIATVGFRNQAYTSCDSRWLYLYFYLYFCLGEEFIYFCHHWYSQTGCCTRNILVIDSHQIYAIPHSLHGTNWVVCKYSPTTSQTVEKYKKKLTKLAKLVGLGLSWVTSWHIHLCTNGSVTSWKSPAYVAGHWSSGGVRQREAIKLLQWILLALERPLWIKPFLLTLWMFDHIGTSRLEMAQYLGSLSFISLMLVLLVFNVGKGLL